MPRILYDRFGFDRFGYNKDGYDRMGYNREGFDRDGYDRNGLNRQGFNKLKSKSPISSKKIVPLSASSKRPTLSDVASVNAPFL